MTKRNAPRKLHAREAKCLAAVYETAAEGYDPSMLAVALLLRGEEEVKRFEYLKTFGSLTSFSIRKIKTMLTHLMQNGYLRAYTPFSNPERYLMLTPSGEEEARKLLGKTIRRKPKTPAAPLFNERN